jgi:hypothetical protein
MRMMFSKLPISSRVIAQPHPSSEGSAPSRIPNGTHIGFIERAQKAAQHVRNKLGYQLVQEERILPLEVQTTE